MTRVLYYLALIIVVIDVNLRGLRASEDIETAAVTELVKEKRCADLLSRLCYPPWP